MKNCKNKVISFFSLLLSPERISATVAITLIALFAVLVAIGVHGSSIGVFREDPAFSRKTADYSYPTIGKYRKVRSDEWNVSTLQVLSQCANDQFFPRINKKIAGGADMFMSTPCNPVWDWTAIGQFHNWGYFLFGAERGMAWNWLCRYLGIALFSFLFFRKRLKDSLLTFAAALAVTLGSPTVWWDTTIPFMLLYFFAGLYGTRLIFQSRRNLSKAGGGLLATVSCVSFCFCGYPFFELLLLPGFIILAASEIAPSSVHPAASDAPKGRRISWIILGGVLAILVAELVYFAVVHAEALLIIKGSSYPGDRIFLGRSFSGFLRTRSLDAWSILSPFCPPRFYPYHIAPNYCSMARYFVPGIAIFACFLFSFRQLKLKRTDWWIFGWGILLVIWGMHEWPVWLAKATGFGIFSPERTDVIGGFFLMLFTFALFLDRLQTKKIMKRPVAICFATVSIVPFLLSVFWPKRFDLFFKYPIGFIALLIALVLVWTIAYSLMRTNRTAFCYGFIILSLLSGLVVHPWSIGISPVRDTQFAEKVLELEKENPGRWLTNRDLTGNLVASLGVDCIPGTMAYAYPGYWGLLDPEGKYKEAWNRYAHSYLNINGGTNFYAKASGSSSLFYNLTEKEIRALGVKHLIWGWKGVRAPWAKYEGRVHLQFFYTVLSEEEVKAQEGAKTSVR